MATYDSLSSEQKEDIATYDKFLRGFFSSISAIGKQADAETWNQFAIANCDAALATLADGETIPNSTNLGGAKPLTVAEFRALQTIARNLKSLSDSNRALLVKAVGVNA